MSPSAFAVEPALIDLDELARLGWLGYDAIHSAIDANAKGALSNDRIDFARVMPIRMALLRQACAGHVARPEGASLEPGFAAFCAVEREWLDDYALFMTIAARHPGLDWQDWPAPLAQRDPAALESIRFAAADEIRFWQFVQWTAARQWRAVKRYANQRGVRIIGDVPIYVAPQSVDVWAQPALFDLEFDSRKRLRPRVLAGVPPDYFSATGQLWGNPIYRWDAHRAEGFSWWVRRLRALIGQSDIVRIDHFRGFVAYWEIAAGAPDASNGRWRDGPGAALFDAIRTALGDLPIIAEDLGIITPEVTALREQFALPGMRVLQFAFDGNPGNAYLPHNYVSNTVVYTGTHDNDTVQGWFSSVGEGVRESVRAYLGVDADSGGTGIHWSLIHAASASVAAMSIYPFQDVLGLGSEARMNRPGEGEGCWDWRFKWDSVHDWHARRLRRISAAHARIPSG